MSANDAALERKDYVWLQNGLYTNPCSKAKCSSVVVMKRSVSDGWHVGVCNNCGTKQIEKDGAK